MALLFFLVATSVLFGYGVSLRFLGAESRWEALSLAPLVACFAVIAGGNAWGPVQGRVPTAVLCGALGLLLSCWPRATLSPAAPRRPLSRAWYGGLALLLTLVIGYLVFAQFYTLDTDNWIHEPLIAGYTLGIFPPVHPFFPEIAMNGHYGRDLLIGTLLPHGTDPLAVVWCLNPVLALATCGVLLAIFRRWGDSPSALLCSVAMPFFGICVGFRVGLADSFDGNNGVVYALAVLLFYVLLRVFSLLPTRRPPPSFGLACAAGAMLGTYQLIYETHFGLFLLTGAVMLVPALLRSSHRARLAAVVALTVGVSLTLACIEGGPLTDLFWSKIQPKPQTDTNLGQHVSMAFPKANLFTVQATSADYQRLSPGFRLESFRSLIPNIEGEGHLNIFTPSFLVAHWLPLFLAPLTLAWLLRRRHWPGLAFWVFGAWAYLVPGLVDFGAVYEWEYFRWEFAAGFALSVPLGLLCGALIDRTPPRSDGALARDEEGNVRITLNRRHVIAAIGWAILILALLPGEKMANRGIIEMQKQPMPAFLHPGVWRAQRPELGVGAADIACARHLAGQILPGEVAMTNLGRETPLGLWPDCVLSALSGCRIAGRARPPQGRRVHAHPNYHRSGLQRALLSCRRPDLLWNSGVDWLLLDPTTTELDEVLAGSPYARLELSENGGPEDPTVRRQLWKLSPTPDLALARLPSQPPFRSQVRLSEPEEGGLLQPLDGLSEFEWRAAKAYGLHLDLANPHPTQRARLGWLSVTVKDSRGGDAVDPLTYLLGANPLLAGTGDMADIAFVTPLEEGDYTVSGTLVDSAQDQSPMFSFPVSVKLFERLSKMQARLEVPGDVLPKSFAPLKLFLTSSVPLRSQGELTLLTRFRREGGDYVWELDRLATPLLLSLPHAGTQVVEWNITAPWREGVYDLELEILDQNSGQRVPITLPKTHITVVAP